MYNAMQLTHLPTLASKVSLAIELRQRQWTQFKCHALRTGTQLTSLHSPRTGHLEH